VLAGCASSASRGTEVTRFHLNQPIASQSVQVVPGPGQKAESIEYKSYLQIVKDQLTATGFDVVDSDDASLQALLSVTREVQQVAPKSSGLSVGIGMGSFGSSGGVSGGVSAPVGGKGGGEVFVTTLAVQLISTAKNESVWEGEAINTAEAAPGVPIETVRMMAEALFSDFPGESGKTISIAPVSAPAE